MALDPQVASASLAAATSINNTTVSAVESHKQYKRTKKLMDYQNNLNIQNWNRQNEYNLPSNQVQRYRDAGLNPALLASNGSLSAGNADGVPGVSNSQYTEMPISPSSFIQNYQDIAQTDLLTKQAASTNADVLDKLFEYALKNENKPTYRNSKLGHWLSDVFLPDIAQETAMRYKTENYILDSTAQAKIQRENDEAAIVAFQKRLEGSTIKDKDGQEVLMSIYKRSLEIDNLLAQKKLTKAQAKYYLKAAVYQSGLTRFVNAQAYGQEQENGMLYGTVDDVVDEVIGGDTSLSKPVKAFLKLLIKKVLK